MMQKDQLIAHIGKLRVFLIAHTLIVLGSIGVYMFAPMFVLNNFRSLIFFSALFMIYRLSVIGYVIWFIQTKYPEPKSRRNNDSWMIFFLGFVGMWLWIPNKERIEQLYA